MRIFNDPEARPGWNRLARHTDAELRALTHPALRSLVAAERTRRQRIAQRKAARGRKAQAA